MNSDEKFIKSNILSGNFGISIASLVSSIIVISWFFLSKNLRSLTYYLVMLMSISEIFNFSAAILSFLELNPKFIEASNCLVFFSDTWNLVLLCFLSYSIYDLINNNNKDIHSKKALFIVLSIIISSIYSFIIIKFGKAIKVDYFSEELSGSVLICTIVHYGFMDTLIFIMIFLIYKVTSYLKKKSIQDPKNGWKILKISYSLYVYPVAGSLGWFFGNGAFILKKFQDKSPSFVSIFSIVFTIMSGIFFNMRGVFILAIFLTSKKVSDQKKKLKEKLFKKMSKINQFQINPIDKMEETLAD